MRYGIKKIAIYEIPTGESKEFLGFVEYGGLLKSALKEFLWNHVPRGVRETDWKISELTTGKFPRLCTLRFRMPNDENWKEKKFEVSSVC
jgi:hypothetical protein